MWRCDDFCFFGVVTWMAGFPKNWKESLIILAPAWWCEQMHHAAQNLDCFLSLVLSSVSLRNKNNTNFAVFCLSYLEPTRDKLPWTTQTIVSQSLTHPNHKIIAKHQGKQISPPQKQGTLTQIDQTKHLRVSANQTTSGQMKLFGDFSGS